VSFTTTRRVINVSAAKQRTQVLAEFMEQPNRLRGEMTLVMLPDAPHHEVLNVCDVGYIAHQHLNRQNGMVKLWRESGGD
jgi:hypothetical protein